MENPHIRIINEWAPRGFSHFEERIWSSSLQRADLPKIRHFLEASRFENIDVSLVIPQDGSASRIRWFRHYQPSGQCISMGNPVSIPIGSNNLKLTFCYKDIEAAKGSRSLVIVVANALRMIFGVPVARELVFESHFSVDDTDGKTSSELGYASQFDNQNLNMFADPPIEDAALMPIPEEAAILLDKAFAQAYPDEQFILLWLAFETIIHLHPGMGNNGEKRKRFFKEELGSDVANAEVFRLFNLRSTAFKEGRFSDANFGQACWSLYAAIQLAIMKDCPQRRAFLAAYELSLAQGVGAAERDA